MPTHRVDIGLKGMSHFIDGELHSASGYPLWSSELPDGLRLRKSAGNPANRNKKFVRKKGFGKSIEWTSDRVCDLYILKLSRRAFDGESTGSWRISGR